MRCITLIIFDDFLSNMPPDNPAAPSTMLSALLVYFKSQSPSTSAQRAGKVKSRVCDNSRIDTNSFNFEYREGFRVAASLRYPPSSTKDEVDGDNMEIKLFLTSITDDTERAVNRSLLNRDGIP